MLEDSIKNPSVCGSQFLPHYPDCLWLTYLHGCGKKSCCWSTAFSLTVKYRKHTKKDSYLQRVKHFFSIVMKESSSGQDKSIPSLPASCFIWAQSSHHLQRKSYAQNINYVCGRGQIAGLLWIALPKTLWNTQWYWWENDTPFKTRAGNWKAVARCKKRLLWDLCPLV